MILSWLTETKDLYGFLAYKILKDEMSGARNQESRQSSKALRVYTQESDLLMVNENWHQIRVNGLEGGLDLDLFQGHS